jgi:Oxygenase domain of the 2OGFeDO superfamily
MIEARLRTRIHPEELEAKTGKIITPGDWNLLITGPAFLRKPDGRPLAVYLPGAMLAHSGDEATWGTFRRMSMMSMTDNRGLASGTRRFRPGTQKRDRTVIKVRSAIAGAIDPGGIYRYCRTTAWTGQHLPEWKALEPFFKQVAACLAQHVPDRYAAQQAEADRSDPAWIVPGTPFSTITANNTYPTGVHTDKGDLDAGFSTITCLRRGEYSGGQLCFPEYRVAVDLRDGDLILMDAHEWHGNAAITCACGTRLNGPCPECGAERISVVSYFRTKIAECGTPEQELARARERREHVRAADPSPA